MAAPMKKKNTGHRYTEAEKKKILAFIATWNKKNGYGGVSAAMKKYAVSYTGIAAWGGTVIGKTKVSDPTGKQSRKFKKVEKIAYRLIAALKA